MALIAMACYSTEENKKDDCLEQTLESLQQTVDFNFQKHRLMLSVNAFTPRTNKILHDYRHIISFTQWNETNLGTASAINLLWKKRNPGEHLIKMDDDITIHKAGWVDEMEEAIAIDNKIGQIALKRKDLRQCPWEESEWFKSDLYMLSHEPGQRWIVVERCADIMGSLVMHNSALIDKVGALFQNGFYGFDDSIMSVRSRLAGFYNCFLPHYEIDHTDEGKTPYQAWKEKHAGEHWEAFQETVRKYKSGEMSVYHPFK